MNKNDFLLLQINDSQFPIGSYTQSYGLETYVQKGLVKDNHSAKGFISAILTDSLLYSELLPVKFAYTWALEGNLSKIQDLEALSLASRSSLELREASLKLGKRFCRTVEGLPLDFSLDFFHKYVKTCEKTGCSHPVAYGTFCATGGFTLESIISTYLYSQISAYVTNCVKLVPLSQTEGQKILCSLQVLFPEILKKLDDLEETDLFLSCVALEIASMEHETLYSRLYMS